MPRLSLIWTHTRAREDDRTVDQMSDHADARLFSKTPLRGNQSFDKLRADGPRGPSENKALTGLSFQKPQKKKVTKP